MSAIIGTAFYWTRIVFREFTKNENYLQRKGEKIMSTHKKVSLSEVNLNRLRRQRIIISGKT